MNSMYQFTIAIKDGKKIAIYMVDKIYELGTPEYLESNMNGYEYMHI